VSLAFYKAGWRGIHVDAVPTYAAKLRDARPDETVIEAAVTDAPGPIAFYELGGLSSGRADVADRHTRDGHQPRKILVPTVQLGHLLDLVDGDLHWAKIDVEGMEADVLRSWGENSKRPWVLVIESTFPNSEETTDHLWADQVLARGYKEVFFDGLSRYFVHESHPELANRLDRPANVFDGFQITSQHFAAVTMRADAEEQAKASEARIAALSLDVLQLRDRLHARDAELANEREHHAERGRRSIEAAEGLDRRLRNAEAELAVERAKLVQLEDLLGQSAAQIETLNEQRSAEQQVRDELNSELVNIARVVGSHPDEFGEPGGKDQSLPAGAVYAAVKSRLALAHQEIQGGREFGIQQFVAGQQSRDTEVRFLGHRISSLQSEIAQAQSRLSETESRLGETQSRLSENETQLNQTTSQLGAAESQLRQTQSEAERDRVRLQSMIDEQTATLNSIKADAAEFERRLTEANRFLSSVYASSGGRLATWLRLLPKSRLERNRPSDADIAPPAPPVTQKPEQVSAVAHQRGMDISVNDIRHTSNLLALNGSAFVDALYRVFLKRSADRAGRDHYIARLQAGHSKEEILVAVADSPEARAVGANIEGLAELKKAQARARLWPLRSSRPRVLDERLNRLEYSIGETHNSLVDRLDRMESSLEQIQAKLESSLRVPPREAGVYVQGVPVSIKRGVSMLPTNGAGEFIEKLRESVQSSMEALSLRNGR
jgi:FkbM family methyltransferase